MTSSYKESRSNLNSDGKGAEEYMEAVCICWYSMIQQNRTIADEVTGWKQTKSNLSSTQLRWGKVMVKKLLKILHSHGVRQPQKQIKQILHDH